MEWLRNLNKTNRYLVVVIVILLLVAVGLYAYTVGSEERYLAKCQSGEQVITDIKNLLGEIKELKGDPDGEDVKDYLQRLEQGKENLTMLENDLRGVHTGSKYRESKQNFLGAVQIEKDILNDTETILKHPLDDTAREAVGRVKEQYASLTETSSGINIPSVDLATAFQVEGIGDSLDGYIAKKIALDAARRAEEERRAREAEEARLEDIQQRLQQKNNQTMASTSDVVWITTHISPAGGNRLDLAGYFYNGTAFPIIQINNMDLHIVLYKRGNQIYQDTFHFDRITWNGLIFPGQRLNHGLFVTSNGGSIPADFDEFDVTMEDANWTYRNG